jgi:hypothetical protein
MFTSKRFILILKRKLLVAHENQISDLAEACKKEMSLLNCLKDSQMVNSNRFVDFVKSSFSI